MTQRLTGGFVQGRPLPSTRPAQVRQLDATWTRTAPDPVEPAAPAEVAPFETQGADWLELLPADDPTDRYVAQFVAHADALAEHHRQTARRAEVSRQIRALEDAVRTGTAAGEEMRRAAKDLLELRTIRDLLDPGPAPEFASDDADAILRTLVRRLDGQVPAPGTPPVVAAEIVHFSGQNHRWEDKPVIDDSDTLLIARFESVCAASAKLLARRSKLQEPLYGTGLLALEQRVRAVHSWVADAATYQDDVERLARDVTAQDRARAAAGHTHWCRREFGWLRSTPVAAGEAWTLSAAITSSNEQPLFASAPRDQDPLAS